MHRSHHDWLHAVFITTCLASWIPALAPATATAVEPWADPALTVTNGLELWLDASRIGAAAAARGDTPPGDQGPVQTWPDASGQRRDVRQPRRGWRPIAFLPAADAAAGSFLRFDGRDDFLSSAVTEKGAVADFTIFIVAAPLSNPGGFRAFLSASAPGKNDYTHGINVDLGGGGSLELDCVSAEGAGMAGQCDLATFAHPFGTFHVLTLASRPGDGAVELRAGGVLQGQRPRQKSAIALDGLWIAARWYSNTPAPPAPSGFLHGDIAEVLFYGRALNVEEREAVEAYLARKHEALLRRKGAGAPAPTLRMLVPGFTVRQLPADITNVNDLAYLPDGRLLALGYDGRVRVLRDADGDGLEESADLFWDGQPLRIPIAMAWTREGLFVTSHKKLTLLRDVDGDSRPDREEVVASDWAAAEVMSGGGVDAMGIAVDPAGAIYFGLGCADFTNPYLLKDGQSRYDPRSERGTILRLPPDRKGREIVCTGIRFPVTLAFNGSGDLFATDQEGETWCPDGNPLDELDHIVPGRYYGFPPRHAQHLPGAIDEPPAVAFGPQHQSTCGLVFNEITPTAQGGAARGVIGPAWWQGDALVAGYSRGKLWRAPLAKTPAGYIGSPRLIGAASMLLLDMAISPAGDMVVACHGGSPDWGNGPEGKGKLFRIAFAGREAPQPVLAWAASPVEARVAFDGPLAPSVAEGLAGAEIPFGEHVRAGDRFEVHRPGYASVRTQLEAPTGLVRVAAARLSPDRRTLILATDPHPARAVYALTIPGVVAPGAREGAADVEIDYALTGVEATWEGLGPDAGARWSGWLPHLDLEAAHAFARGSAEHEMFEALLARAGRLRLGTRLVLPRDRVWITIDASSAFTVACEGLPEVAGGPGKPAVLALEARGAPMPLAVTIETGSGKPLALHASFHRAEDPIERPISPGALILPWAPDPLPGAPAVAGPPPELAGGSWKRGEAIFFGAEARCSLCHKVRGRGSDAGPDLSNLPHRDPASVLRDIAEPSAALNPDHVASTVITNDGRVLSGIARADGAGRLRILDSSARETLLDRGEVGEIQASSISVMPEGLAEILGPARLRDLLVFLLAPEPPREERAPLRTRAEVEALMETAARAAPAEPAGALRPLRAILVAGPKDHGPGEHDYPAWQKGWSALLAGARAVSVETAWAWPSGDQWKTADAVVLYFWNHEWSDGQYADLDAFFDRGGALIALHSAVIPPREPAKLAARLGLAWEHGKTKFRHGPLDLEIEARDHPITKGFGRVHFLDESYWPLAGDRAQVEVLATSREEGQPQAMAWTYTRGRGRAFSTLLGHYSHTFDDPLFRLLFFRALAWTTRSGFERFAPLVTRGVTFGGEPAAAGRASDELIEEAARECEAFRRRLLERGEGGGTRARLIGRAIDAFRGQAQPRLARKPMEGFTLDARAIETAVSGAGPISGKAVFGAFDGRWHGHWRDRKVNHDWSETVEPERPREISGEPRLWIRAHQYAWIGDGYGVNLVATGELGARKDFILGHVVHVKDGDPAVETARRPHVGVAAGEGRLIWITAGEVFLEEIRRTSAGDEEYAITGFNYRLEGDRLEAREGFQAVYTRDPGRRPAWLAFPIDVRVEGGG